MSCPAKQSDRSTDIFLLQLAMRNIPDGPNGYLTIQFLTWLSEASRTYGQALDAWRTSCPRLSIWEDALEDGLVQIEAERGPMRQSGMVVTSKGKTLLERQYA